MRKSLAVGAFLALAATHAVAADLSKLDALAPGDTRQRVVEIMGKPGNRQITDTREALQWCKSGLFSNYYGLVILHDGKVFSIRTATTQGDGGSCGKVFPTIEWVMKPDTAVEIINH